MFSLSKLLNEKFDDTIKVVFPGRFQPFSIHHLEVYKNFVNQYGKNNVYIVTTNKTNNIDSPFNFIQKRNIMEALGVPSENIIEVKNTYAPIIKNNLTPGWEKILHSMDKLIVIVGEKDSDRLKSGTYYKPFTEVEKMEDYTKHAYTVIYKSDIKYKDILTGKMRELNGTSIRNIFTNKNTNINQKYQQFQLIYKSSDKKLFNYMYKILNKNLTTESVIAEGIKHIEDLKPKELLDFLSSWNIDNKKFEVSEKVDGVSLRFGMNQDGFYVSSKTKQFHDVEEYPPLYFYDTFKKYHSILQGIDFIEIVKNVIGKDIKDVQFIGEAIATYDSNIILYDKNIIGEGVYIVFSIIADGVKLDNIKLKEICEEINKQSEITFYPNFIVNAENIKFEEKYITTLRTIIEKYGNILSKPVRNPVDKALKEKVKKIINLIGTKSKQSFLGQMSNYKSGLGSDVEGFVIKLPNGDLVKFVDKNKFTDVNLKNWKYIDIMKKLYQQFKSELQNNPSLLRPAFKKLYKDSLELYDDFKKIGDMQFTIPKKKQNTIESFKIHFKKLDKIKSLLGVENNDVLVNKILNNKLDESLLAEGGKMFSGVKEIPNEYVIPTIDFCLKNLNMSDLKYILVGNYKKPMMGDIDFGVDAVQLAQVIGSKFNIFEDRDKFFTDLKEYVNTNKTKYIIDYKIMKGLQQLSIACPAVDSNNNFISGINVQLDMMIGNKEWMKKALGPAIDSKYKAAHRNLLYIAAFSQIEMETDDVNVKRKYQFATKSGVEIVDFIYDNKGKRVKLGKNLITGNVEDMVHLLFDESVSFNDVNSFESLYKMMLTDKFKFPELRNKIFKEFVITVKNMKLPIPAEMKKYE